MPAVKIILLFAAMIIIGPGAWLILGGRNPEESENDPFENNEFEDDNFENKI